jgi:Tfp pilus assembly protein PilV
MTRTLVKFDDLHRAVAKRQIGNLSSGRRQIKNLSYDRGFTLLEVMLALGLTMIIVVAVGSAIAMYLRIFDSGRANIEEAQLARTILRRMADDIRGSIRGKAATTSSATPAATTTSTTLTPGTSTTTTNTGTVSSGSTSSNTNSSTNFTVSGAATTEENDTTVSTISDSTDLASLGPQSAPGLYGNSTQIQLDTSRLPRLDQYMSANASQNDPLGDMRNITYFVLDSTGIDAADQPSGGLMRRDSERTSALYGSQFGQTDPLATSESIAPEVQAIQFAYFSGESWQSSWDSNQAEILPLAIQITISIARPADKYGNIPPPGVYSIVVSISAAAESASATSDPSTSSGTSSDTTSSSDLTSSSSSSMGDTNSSSSQNNQQNGQQNNQQNKSGGG